MTHSLIPSIWRYFDRGTFIGKGGVEMALVILLLIINSYFYLANFSFMILGVFDMKRRFYSVSDLSRLLDLNNLNKKKTFLMMDFLSEISLNTWGNIYKLMSDYGRKYYFRINGIVTVFLTFYLVIGILLLLTIFEVIVIIYDPLLIIVFSFEVISHLIAIVFIFFYGASINSQLFDNKKNLKEIKDQFFQVEMFLQEKANSDIYPHSYFIREALARIKDQAVGSNAEEIKKSQVKKLQKLIKTINMLIQQQGYRAKYFPVKFLGTVADFMVLRSGIVTFASILFAVIQFYLNKLYNKSGTDGK